MLHANEMHNSLGLLACQSPHKHLLTAQGPADTVTVSVPPEYASRVARPVDGPLDTAHNCDAMIPKAKATEGEPIRTSRLQTGESQSRPARLAS